jgi:hypothetical protein
MRRGFICCVDEKDMSDRFSRCVFKKTALVCSWKERMVVNLACLIGEAALASQIRGGLCPLKIESTQSEAHYTYRFCRFGRCALTERAFLLWTAFKDPMHFLSYFR